MENISGGISDRGAVLGADSRQIRVGVGHVDARRSVPLAQSGYVCPQVDGQRKTVGEVSIET